MIDALNNKSLIEDLNDKTETTSSKKVVALKYQSTSESTADLVSTLSDAISNPTGTKLTSVATTESVELSEFTTEENHSDLGSDVLVHDDVAKEVTHADESHHHNGTEGIAHVEGQHHHHDGTEIIIHDDAEGHCSDWGTDACRCSVGETSDVHPDDQSTTVVTDDVDDAHDHGEDTTIEETATDHTGHGDHAHGDEHEGLITPPVTPAEIEAFVQAVRSAPEGHAHTDDAGKMTEHTAVLNLVPRGEATHIAINHGDWDDPGTWYNGQIPGGGAKVLIPQGIAVEYNHVSDVSLFTVRVDGFLDFATDTDSRMEVDTLIVSPSGSLQIGTAEHPVEADVNVDIVIANNGDINVAWDPMLLSRGVVSHGAVEIHGAEKTTHLKVATDPMAGDRSITLAEAPEGWRVGDTIVLAGTNYEGYKWDNAIRAVRFYESEDEVLTITGIEGNVITFDRALVHDHDAPRDDLKTSVANYTRNVSIESEDGADSAVHERGHVMLMHSDNIDVRYAEFSELGRTDKSERSIDLAPNLESDSNVKGRYSLHLHRTGVNDLEDPAILEGNAVYGSPGWGIVQHDSGAIIHDNATFNTHGAGYVAETGNETGIWSSNIAIGAQGENRAVKDVTDMAANDIARTGDGFFFHGRMVDSVDNIAASVAHGFVYMHRATTLNFDSDVFDLPEALGLGDSVGVDDAPIMNFTGNEVLASTQGLHVVKSNPNQGHDVHSHLLDFTAWNVVSGAALEYTSHYVLENFDIIGKENTAFNSARTGISVGNNASDFIILNAKVDGFAVGINVNDVFVDPRETLIQKQHFIIGADITNTARHYQTNESGALNPAVVTILEDSSSLVPGRFAIDYANPLVYNPDWRAAGGPHVDITGTKTDSLGTTVLPSGTDNYNVFKNEVIKILETDGYYTASDGKHYFIIEDYYSDRITTEIHKVGSLVEIPASMVSALGNQYSDYRNAVYRGEIDLDSVAPVTADDVVTTTLETAVIINVLANDSDPDGDALFVDGIIQPINGRVFNNGDGTITYRPNLEFVGTETFKYWATDKNGHFTSGLVTVTVEAASDDDHDPEPIPDPAAAPLLETIKYKPTMFGDDFSNIMQGTAENNRLFGKKGHDVIYGGEGHDLIRGHGGFDTMYGGVGNDIIYFAAKDKIVDGGVGFDTAIYNPDGDFIVGLVQQLISIEKLDFRNEKTNKVTLDFADILQSENDTLYVFGDASDSVVLQGAFEDVGEYHDVNGIHFTHYLIQGAEGVGHALVAEGISTVIENTTLA